MVAYGQKKLNSNDVRNATTRFILSFVLLTAFSLFTVFMFFKSSEAQIREIAIQKAEYQKMIQNNGILKVKMDEIYEKMSMVGNNQVNSDNILIKSINSAIDECKQVIANDSLGSLQQYHFFLKDVRKIVKHKNEIVTLNNQENAARRNLEQCQQTDGKVRDRLMNPPKERTFRDKEKQIR